MLTSRIYQPGGTRRRRCRRGLHWSRDRVDAPARRAQSARGRGAAAAAWAAAEPILRAAGCTPQLVETKRPGHARELLAALPRGACDAVVVAGGDGSLHEAVNGLMAAGTPRPPLALIPAGTGNSLAADLECLDPHQAARAIADGRTQPLDVMEVRLGPAGVRGAGAAAASAAVGAAPALPRTL